MILIPVLDANDSLIECDFGGQVYFLRMSWNSEAAMWVMSLEDYANNVIVAGIRVLSNSALLGLVRHLPVPTGEIWCVLKDETREELLRTDFADSTASLIYLELGEDVTV